MQSYQERRERALIIVAEKLNLFPSDMQVEAAVWGVTNETKEVIEEVTEWINAARAFPRASKHEVFFGEYDGQ